MTLPARGESAPRRGVGALRRPGRRWWPHTSSIVAGALLIGIALGASAGVQSSIHNGQDRALQNEARNVRSALDSTVSSVQSTLIAALRVASASSPSGFEAIASSNVGAHSQFQTVTLWRQDRTGVVELASVGRRPLLSAARQRAFLNSVVPSPRVSVVDLLAASPRSVGFAEMLPGNTSPLIAYAETAIGSRAQVHFDTTSPFYGLDFAIYLGNSPASSTLIESSIDLSKSYSSRTTTVPFGNSHVTIVTAIVGRPAGVLPYSVPWIVAIGGTLLGLAAGAFVDVQVRRRRSALVVADVSQRRYEDQRRVASHLQEAIRPDPHPKFPGLEIATRYVPGVSTLDVGGDWYDVISLGPTRVFISVGDVSGRGLSAATLSSSIRSAIRAYAVQGDAPDEVLRKLSALYDVVRDGHFATVLCVRLDVANSCAEFSSAGHLPPLVVEGASSQFLPVPVTAPVGVRGGPEPSSIEVNLAPAATIVMFTDGLVERRGIPLDEGLDRLALIATTRRGSLDSILNYVVRQMVERDVADDVAIIALRQVEHAERVSRALRRNIVERDSFEASVEAIGAARTFVKLAINGLPAETIDVATLLTSELVTNAVVHARARADVEVRYDSGNRQLRISVTNAGHGTLARRTPKAFEPTGRGLQIVENLAHRWGVEAPQGTQTTTVWFILEVQKSAL